MDNSNKRKRSVESNAETRDAINNGFIQIKLCCFMNKKNVVFLMMMNRCADYSEINSTIKKTLEENFVEFSDIKIFGVFKEGTQKISMTVSTSDQAKLFWSLNYCEFNVKLTKGNSEADHFEPRPKKLKTDEMGEISGKRNASNVLNYHRLLNYINLSNKEPNLAPFQKSVQAHKIITGRDFPQTQHLNNELISDSSAEDREIRLQLLDQLKNSNALMTSLAKLLKSLSATQISSDNTTVFTPNSESSTQDSCSTNQDANEDFLYSPAAPSKVQNEKIKKNKKMIEIWVNGASISMPVEEDATLAEIAYDILPPALQDSGLDPLDLISFCTLEGQNINPYEKAQNFTSFVANTIYNVNYNYFYNFVKLFLIIFLINILFSKKKKKKKNLIGVPCCTLR
jgi:hypothetical protein